MLSDSNGSLVWRWKSIQDLGFDDESINYFEKMLEDRVIKQSNKRDTLSWVASNDGKYNVKSGYKAIIEAKRPESVDIPLKLCWDSSCLSKVGFFLWLAIQNKILSIDRLITFGIQGPSRCVLCQHDSKNTDHLLYLCPYSQKCWE